MPEPRSLARLMLVTDRRRSPLPLVDLALKAVAGGVDTVQIREKDLGAEELIGLVRVIRHVVGRRARLSLNADPALAAELGLDVHLPEAGPSTAAVRQIVGPTSLIGRSIHSAEAAAANADADYLIAGHVFRSRSKPGLLPLGLDGLAAIVAAATVPVLAIGGISVSNVEGVLQTGAFGVAVIDAIASATDPRAAASTLRQVIDQVDAKEQTMSTAAEETIVTVNGKDVAVPSGASVADFLMSKGFREKLVVVELNGRILDRGRFASTPLAAGDKVEIVHFVGGG